MGSIYDNWAQELTASHRPFHDMAILDNSNDTKRATMLTDRRHRYIYHHCSNIFQLHLPTLRGPTDAW